METITEYVERRGIACEILKDRGAQIEDGWEHHAYVVALHLPTGERIETPWRQGYGVETSPEDTPDIVLDSLVGDVTELSFEDWIEEYGGNPDSRREYATWETCSALAMPLGAFLGGADALDYLLNEVEGL